MAEPAGPPLVQYWHAAADQPDYIAECLGSFKALHPDMQHVVFDEPAAEQFIAEHLSAREVEAFRACAVPAMQADYFRYCAVYALGGVYVDADVHCIRSVKSLLPAAGEGFLVGRVKSGRRPAVEGRPISPYRVGAYRVIENGMFAFAEPGHPLLELAIQVATANVENRIADGSMGVWLTTGPAVFTSIYLLNELGSSDAFVEYAAESVLRQSAALFCETVGSYDRVARICEGVRIRPTTDIVRRFVVFPQAGERPPTHWSFVEGSIFR